MGTGASLPYDEETLKKLRGVVTMRYYGTEPESAVPMKDGVEMVFECATEEQVVEVPQTVLPMVYGRGHEAHSFHNRAPPLSNPNELEGDQDFHQREKTLEASIQAQYKLDDFDKDVIGYISEMPPIHPLHIDRRRRARLMKADGNLPRALERTKVGVEEQKRRELAELRRNKNKNKNKEPTPVAEPSWDKIEADEETEEAAQARNGKTDQEQKGEQGNRANTQGSKGANTGKPKGAKTESKQTQPPTSKNTGAKPTTSKNTGAKPTTSKSTGVKPINGEKEKGQIEEKKIDFDAIAASKAKKKHVTFEQEERERQLRRRDELRAQRSQERLLHIINDF